MTFDFWTLGFQAVNVLVLVWLLHRFFWKPVSAMITTRQATAASMLEEAGVKRSEAEAALAEAANKLAALAAEREAMLATARTDSDATRDTLLSAAQAEVETLRDTAKAARVLAAGTLKANAMDEAQGLALTIAGKLMARLDGPATDAAFLNWLVKGLGALTDVERTALAGVELEVVSAANQDSTAQDRIAKAIADALGASAALTFRSDPALIAGHEIHSAHFSLRNSWRADLDRIAAALAKKGDLSDAG
ncbi:F0F1 ATP synthase subunit delta [Cypionkella psychrotolerans]|uniref:F0F1 ATP synthase subunit delta n=1 Tax=Cypionkella psychrotolerans TaxID=1678131 RepID=UPI0006B5F9DB|nr:F0F1 ATP synthase subunit delta [Cypionkella psychrotolerans]